MAVHEIMIPDPWPWHRGELRSVVWDDVAGTVDGDHRNVPWIQETLALPKPVDAGSPGVLWTLDDPGHDPAEMLVLLVLSAERPPEQLSLPPIFDGVALPEGEPDEELYDERGELLT